MRSIVRGVVALFAAFCIIDVAKAAPTIVSPAENAEVKTISDKIWNDIHNDSIYLSQATFYEGTHTGTYRKSAMADVNTNSVPIKLKWSGTSGECTVKVWRTKDLTANSSASPIFSTKVTGTTATYWDPEVGRNFTWSVTDSTGASATGHFYTIQRTPRVIYGDQNPNSPGADCSAGRDIGGWLTEDKTKRVRQGLVFRSAQIEYCSSGADDHIYYPLTYLKDVVGIKLDIDLRTDSHLGKYYAYPTNKVWTCSWKKGNADYSDEYLRKEESNIGPGVPRFCVDTSYAEFPSYTGFTSNNNNKKSVWAAFKQIHDRVTKTNPEAVLFHCSHGKDRTGSLAYVLLGALGVSETDARRDFGFTWYLEAKSDVAMDTEGDDGYEGLTKLLNALPSGSTFKARCVAYLKACGTAAGDSNPEGKITAFQNAMLEAVEYQEDVYELPEEDSFEYVNCYTKREEGSGGSLGSSCAIYTTASGTKKYSVQDPELLSYSVCLHFYPYSSYKYARPIAGMFRAGKVIFDGTYALNNGRPLTEGEAASLGAWSFKPYFSNEGHTLSDRAVIEVRAGYADVDNFDLYLTDWGKDKYTAGRVSVYNGYASIDIWKDATFVVRDFVAVSPEKTYIKFPEGNCANARFEARETDQGPENIAGWFSGGQSGTKQHIVVENTFLKFSASGKTSGVAGALGLEFELGANNKTTTAAMLQVTGALNINAGSTITVDAGGKGAGTYKLVSAGTLTDYANLDLRSNYTVTNCKSGYYGTIVKSGNNINLTIQEGTPPAEDEGLIDTEKEGDWGYRLKIGNEIVLAFTNHTKSVNWQVPSKLENVQFLVVGGGGGGGADTHASNTHGGAGGGGGGVVTGLVNFAENSVITVSVGAGGNGGVTATQGGSNSKYGAAYSGNASYVIVDGSEYFWTAGGGGDNGANESSNAPKTIGNVGNSGGSSAGSRPGQTERGAVVPSRVASVSNVKYADTSFGRQGGAGYYVTPADDSNTYYGYFSAAGGGGGATTEGETASTAKAAGKGGEGLASDITGTLRVYGSGGGGGAVAGGCGALGGTGAGCGNMTGVTAENYANYVNAVANQGGGGGGAARGIPGGKGGSGIVVLRYVDPDYSDPYVVAVPTAISGLTFTGSELTGVASDAGYTITGNKATNVGDYTAIATLLNGYTWADGTTAAKNIDWSIAKAKNVWTTEPSITSSSWIVGRTPGELIVGVAKFGEVVATMGDSSFNGILPTEIGSYTIVFSVEGTDNYEPLSKTVSFEITEVPVINPTEYGTADSTESTYTWIGCTGPWMYTTNWTATASGTYGVPNNGTYATADFPATLANAFTCTLNQSVSVKYAKFDAPNMNLVLDNATLTITDRVDSGKYVAYKVGTNDNANVSVELSGANAGIVSSKKAGAALFGVEEESASGKIRCTVRFIVPATGWESTAPIRATGEDCSVYFLYDTKLEIDATALGVPAENETKQVVLASSTNRLINHGRVEITCADGVKGTVAVVGTKLVLTVEADETTEPDEPQEPQLTAVDVPVAQTGLVYTGSELTGVESGTGYTLTGNTATDAGEYTATATLAEGYKWSDDTTADKSITWVIAKATNEWTTEPSISLTEWTQGETAGVLTAGVAKFGTVTASMTELPTEVGTYAITYTVAETKNYTGLNATVQFEIKAPEVVEPDEPGDDEPVSQIPTIPAEWGYVKTDLGDLHNEVAVVFTNHVDKAMSWTVPADIENVQFLVVGGGGGGGGCIRKGSSYVKNDDEGGAGGGGGGVVTGLVKFNKGDVVSVAVGVGGTGGTGAKNTSTAGSGAGTKGGESNFYVGDNLYIKAFGGGGDGGYEKAGAVGGSSAGCRPNKTSASRSEASIGTKGANAAEYLSDVVFRGNTGGAGYTSCTSGGGGGATAAGSKPGNSGYGGAGGAGLTLSIVNDVAVTYGSGGGGGGARTDGHGGQGGDGAGNGGAYDDNTDLNGVSGAPNQGGGGGGGSCNESISTTTFGNGGNGGSGIVVFRYTLKSEVKVDAAEYIESKLTDKVYTGSLLMSGLTEDTAYTVSEEGGVNVGEYTVQVTLKSGYVWADGNTSSTSNFTWKITKNANEWATEPLLSVTSWAQGYAPNVKFVAPVQTIGELNATITTNGVTEAFSGTLPTEPGDYTINYSVAETDNYAGRTWSASFKIYRSEPIEGGYKVFGLGEDGNEEAMVFTESGNWNIDKNLKNVQFLVVGGGGGGGADNSKTSDQRQAGSGGGGGGVVTGLVNFAAGQTVAITVGAGGQGAERGGSTSPYGAVKTQAENSSFAIGTATSVVAFAGGGDTGSINNSSDSTGGQTGGNGGSSAGSRSTATGRGEATCGSVTDTANAIITSNALGNKGGAGAAQYQAGGGGGATSEGEDGTENAGGNGGEGLASNITGTDLVYGSGGGGGAVSGGAQGPGLGGTGAGNGGHGNEATSADPSQGGGGGGGGRVGNGGNGGSGIVVFRYIVNTTPMVGDVEVKADANGVITNITTACDNFAVVGDISNYKFADYYTASVTDEGKLKIALNPEVATPVINETASDKDDAIVVTDDTVTLGITNAKVGLFYSVEAYSDPTCAGDPIIATTPELATSETLNLGIDKPNVDAAFFRVVVTDIPTAE